MYVVGIHKKCLGEVLLVNTQCMFSWISKNNVMCILLLFGAIFICSFANADIKLQAVLNFQKPTI